MKSGLCVRTGHAQLTGWTEKKLQSPSQSQTCTRKGGLPLASCSTAFWLPVKPLHLRSMLSKSMRCIANCSTCLWCWWTERAQFFSIAAPNCMPYNQCLEVEQIGLWSFAISIIFTCHLANWLPLLQTSRQLFAEKTLPQPAGGRKCFPGVHQILKGRFLCYRDKQTYFWLARMCWLQWFLFWLLKMC